MDGTTVLSIDTQREQGRKRSICRAVEGLYAFLHVDPRDDEPSRRREFETTQEVISAWLNMLAALQDVTRIFDRDGDEYAVQWYNHAG